MWQVYAVTWRQEDKTRQVTCFTMLSCTHDNYFRYLGYNIMRLIIPTWGETQTFEVCSATACYRKESCHFSFRHKMVWPQFLPRVQAYIQGHQSKMCSRFQGTERWIKTMTICIWFHCRANLWSKLTIPNSLVEIALLQKRKIISRTCRGLVLWTHFQNPWALAFPQPQELNFRGGSQSISKNG